jgi:CBS domain-containing protein
MKIKGLKPKNIVNIAVGDTLRMAAKHLADDEIGALAVFNSRGLAGIFSERDLVRAVADGVDLDETQVDDYMTQAPITIDQEAPIGEAIARMNEYGIRHLLVKQDEYLVGMISIRDLMNLLGTRWPEL